MENQRGFSALEIKAVDEKSRTIRGWATTPALDRVNDSIDPLGVMYKNPMPLLHHHRHSEPVGTTKFQKPTVKGIEFEASLPVIQEEGLLKERVDLAWQEVKYGLVRAVSVGFRPLKYSFKDDGGVDFLESEVYELSLVTIPANSEAIITALKSMQLTPSLVNQLKTLDRKPSSIKLVSPKAVSTGAVRLIRPNS